jgi:hypothetical protein
MVVQDKAQQNVRRTNEQTPIHSLTTKPREQRRGRKPSEDSKCLRSAQKTLRKAWYKRTVSDCTLGGWLRTRSSARVTTACDNQILQKPKGQRVILVRAIRGGRRLRNDAKFRIGNAHTASGCPKDIPRYDQHLLIITAYGLRHSVAIRFVLVSPIPATRGFLIRLLT